MLFQLHYQKGYSFETMRSRAKCRVCSYRQDMKDTITWCYNVAKLSIERMNHEKSLDDLNLLIDKTKH